MKFVFEQIRIGGDRNFGYLVGDRDAKLATIVDPAFTPDAVVERAAAQGLKVTHIVNTHGHGDHVNGNAKVKELTGAPVAIFKDSAVPHDIGLEDNGTLKVGAYTLRFLHTPGHIPDHMVVYVEEPKVAITGDLIFVGKVGGTGTEADARTEWASLQRVLKELPDDATIWPGHDYGCRPASTIALEKATNPFMRCKDLGEFLALKAGWATFKAQHGLK